MATDSFSRSLRTQLASIGKTTSRYATGSAKLFLASGKEMLDREMPALVGTFETNHELLADAIKFLRNPVDTLNRQIDRALGSEAFKELQKVANNAVEDLKSGNLYDAERSRDSTLSQFDDLLGDFGGFDMSGFDDTGEWNESESSDSDVKTEIEIAKVQEENADNRTEATIKAVTNSTTAIIRSERASSQSQLRMQMKQHSQQMNALQNMISAQTSTFTLIHKSVEASLQVTREAHADYMKAFGEIKGTLEQIRDQLAPADNKNQKKRQEDEEIFGTNGSFNIKAYLRGVAKNVDNQYGISSMMSMLTMGQSPADIIRMYADNPLQIITDLILGQAVPNSVKKQMNRTSANIGSFIPAMLNKISSKGKRGIEGRDPTLMDLITSSLGVEQKSRSTIDTNYADPLGKATFTNKFTRAVEEVIPMWLARIDSHISGLPMQIYNYETGELEKVADVVAKNMHDANDLAGRMGDTKWNIMSRANKYKFKTRDEKEDFQSFIYQWLQKQGEDSAFINPYVDRDQFMESMKIDGFSLTQQELYYSLLMGILKTMPNHDLMRMSGDIHNARVSRNENNLSLNNRLKDSGLIAAFSGFEDKNLIDEITRETKKRQYGLTGTSLESFQREKQAEALKSGGAVAATNSILNDILGTLKKGIIVYSYGIGEATGVADVREVLDTVRSSATNQYNIERKLIADAQTAIIAKDEKRRSDLQRSEEDMRNNNDGSDPSKFYVRNGMTSADAIEIQASINSRQDRTEANNGMVEQYRKWFSNAVRDVNPDLAEFVQGSKMDRFMEIARDAVKSPIKMFDAALKLTDAFLFKALYGDEVAGDVELDDGASLIRVVTQSVQKHFVDAKDWFSKNIGAPLKDFFFGKENGLFPRIADTLKTSLVDPAKEKVKGKVKQLDEKIRGKYDEETGTWSGGRLSDQMNKLHARKENTQGALRDRFDDALNNFLYGGNADGHGVRVVQNRDKNGQFTTGKHKEYSGAIGGLRKGFDNFKEYLFGPEDEDTESKQKWKKVTSAVNEAFPDMAIGGGVGLLAGLFLPGGPILGAVLGSAGGLIKGSSELSRFLFGEFSDEDEIVYDENGLPVKDRKGNIRTRKKQKSTGLISREVYEGFKQYAPKIGVGALAGAAAGGLGLLPFGLGPVVGGVLGAIGGMGAASDKIKELIFGNYEDPKSGLISKEFRGKVIDAVKKYAPGVAIGGAAGGILGNLLGAGLGLIPGLSMLPTGPIFAALGSMTGLSNAESINKFLFGEDIESERDVLDANGKPTGKKEKVKERKGGVFAGVFNTVRDNVVTPIAKKFDEAGKNIGSWFKESIIGPLSRSMEPLKEHIAKAGESIFNAFKNIGDHITGGILDALGIGDKFKDENGEIHLGKFFKEKVLKRLEETTNRMFSMIGKVLGSIISAPFKALELLVTGKINGESIDDSKDRKNKEREEKREAARQKRSERRHRRAAKVRQKGWDKSKGFVDNLKGLVFGLPVGDRTLGDVAESSPDEVGTVLRNADQLANQTNAVLDGELKTRTERPDNTTGNDTKDPGNAAETNVRNRVKAAAEATTKANERSEKDTKVTLADKALDEGKEQSSKSKSKGGRSSSSDAPKGDNLDGKRKEKDSDDGGSKKKGIFSRNKSNNEYLKDISKNTGKIFEEIKGQLGGSGWNIAYIKTLLEKHFNDKLSDEELPEEMEGSKKVKKKRGFFGRMMDRVTGVFDGVGSTIKDKVSGLIDMVTHPFRLVGKAIGGIVDGVKAAGSTLLGIAKTIGSAIGDVLKGAAQGLGEVLKGAGEIIHEASHGLGQALGDVVSALTGVLKDGVLAASSVVRGLIETAADIAPDIAAMAWKGMKAAGGMVGKGVTFAAKGVGSGLKWAFDKITGRGKDDEDGTKIKTKVKKIGKVQIDGGYLDEIKQSVPVAVGGDLNVPFPYVTVLNGNRVRWSPPNIAIPVYVVGYDVIKPKGDQQRNSDNKDGGSNTSSSGGQETPSEQAENGADSPTVPRDAPASAKDAIRGAFSKAKNEMRKKVDAFKKKYFRVDQRAEKSNNPAEEYDRALKSATSEEEIEAIQAAQQMNANDKIISSGSEEKSEGGGILSSLLSLLLGGGGGGIGGTLLGKAGNLLGTAGKAITNSGIGQTVGGFFKNTALPALAEAGGMAATAYNIFGEKGNTGWGLRNAAYGAMNIAKTAAGGAATNTGPIQKAIGTLINKLLGNATVQSMFGALKSKLGTLAQKLTAKLSGTVLEKAMKSGAATTVKNSAKQIAAWLSAGGLQIVFSVADFVAGFGNAKKYFNVFGSDVTLAMRLTSAVVNTLGGLLNLIPGVGPFLTVAVAMVQDEIVQFVYGILAGDAAKAELAADQQKLQAATDAYNAENGTNLTTDQYAAKFNEDGSKRRILSTIGGGLKAAGGAIVGGAKKVGEFALNAVTGIPDALAKGATWIGDKATALGEKFNEFITHLPETVSNGINNLFSKVGDVLTNLPTTVGKFIGDSLGNVIKGIGGIGEFAVKLGGGVIKGAINLTGGIGNMVLGIAKGIGNVLLGGLKTVISHPETLGNMALSVGKGIINTIGSAIGGTNNLISEIVKGIGNAVKEALGGIGEAIDETISNIPVVGDVYNGAKGLVGGSVDTVKGVASAVDSGISSIPLVGGVYNGAKGLASGALNMAESVPLLGGLVKGTRGLFGGGPGMPESSGWGTGLDLPAIMDNIDSTLSGIPILGTMYNNSKISVDILRKMATWPIQKQLEYQKNLIGGISNVKDSIGDFISGAISNVRNIAEENGIDTSSVGGFLNSIVKDPKSLANALSAIGSGFGGSLINLMSRTVKSGQEAVSIFGSIGQGLGSALVNDMKDTDGSGVTISDSLAAGSFAAASGSDSAVATAKTSSIWDKVKGVASAGINAVKSVFGWGKGPVTPMSQKNSKYNVSGAGNMALTGCGPTAAAMVASAYGKRGDPVEASKMSYSMGMRASDGGTNPAFFSQYGASKGFGMRQGPVDAGKISTNLSKGNPVVLMGKGGAFGSNTHYLVATGTNGRGGMSLADPLTGSTKNASMRSVLGNTSNSIYSYGKGRWGTGPVAMGDEEDKTGVPDSITNGDTGSSNTKTGGNPLNKPFKVTSPFGNRNLTGTVEGHKGIDIVPTDGSGQADVGSRWNGTISYVVSNIPDTHTGLGVSTNTGGNMVFIKTDEGITAKHMHLKAGSIPSYVTQGARIKVGQKIGEMGTTGRSTGRHLHYQLEDEKGIPFNPIDSANGGDTLSSFSDGGSSYQGSSSGTTLDTSNPLNGISSDGTLSSSINAVSSLLSKVSERFGNALAALLGQGTTDSTTGDVTGDTSFNTSTTNGTTFNFGESAGTTDPTVAKKTTWNWLRNSFGLTENGAAGLMGCWQAESSNSPTRLEGDYLKAWKNKYKSVDEVLSSNANLNDYTANYLFPAYDNSGISISKNEYKMDDGNYYPGMGLAQWTKSRAYKLMKFAKEKGMDWRSLDTQLQYFKQETETSYKNLKSSLNAATSPEEGARAALDGFEMYAGWSNTEKGQQQLKTRAQYAAQIYNTYHGTSGDDDAPNETGKGPGLGGDACDNLFGTGNPDTTNVDALNSRISNMNATMAKINEEAKEGSEVSTITDKLAEAVENGMAKGGGSSDGAAVQLITSALAQMIELLAAIKDNTAIRNDVRSMGSSSSSTSASARATGGSAYANVEDVGAAIVDRLTSK